MDRDELSDVVDAAYPVCPNDGTRLVDHVLAPGLRCPECGLALIG